MFINMCQIYVIGVKRYLLQSFKFYDNIDKLPGQTAVIFYVIGHFNLHV